MSIISTLPKAKVAFLRQEWHRDTQWRKRRHMNSLTFDEFVAEIYGKVERTKPKSTDKLVTTTSTYRRGYEENKLIPSKEMTGAAAPLKPVLHYSGERKLLGIATLHKSSMVPVFDQQSAIDIAQMRRN